MTTKNSTTTALLVPMLKITAMILAYFGVNAMAEILSNYNQTASIPLPALFSFLMLTFSALLFWFKPQPLAKLLTNESQTTTIKTPFGPLQLLNTAILFLGLCIFVFAFIDLAKWLIYINYLNQQHPTNLQNVAFFNILVRLAVSMFLLVKSSALSHFLLKNSQAKK